MKVEIFKSDHDQEPVVKLTLLPTEEGVDVAAVDDEGQVISYLAEISADGIYLYTSVPESLGFQRDRNRRLAIHKDE